MRKFALTLMTALLVVGLAVSAEAANKLQMIRSTAPKVVSAATQGLGKMGDGVSNFFWRNKIAITTGTALVTAATHPELVAESVVAVANGPPTVVLNSDGRPTEKRDRSDWSVYAILGGVAGLFGLIGMYKFGGRAKAAAKMITALLVGVGLFSFGVIGGNVLCGLIAGLGLTALWKFGGKMRTAPKIVTTVLLVAILLFCCGIVRADDFSTIVEPACIAWPFGWRFFGDRLLDIVLVLVMLLFPFA